MKILFVCTGNTCRSPMAEALARLMSQAEGIEAEIRSAGLAADAVSPASPGAMQAMAGLADLTGHRSQPVTAQLLAWADVVAVMTAGHRHQLLTRWPEAQDKTYLISVLADSWEDVLDPFGQKQEVYNETREQITKLLKIILPKLKKRTWRTDK